MATIKKIDPPSKLILFFIHHAILFSDSLKWVAPFLHKEKYQKLASTFAIIGT